MRCPKLILILLVILLAGPALAKGGGKKKKKVDKRKVMLTSVGKLMKAGDASGIADYFRKKGKIELKLSGITNGKYRGKQARSLLKSYFDKIKPVEYKLKDVKDTYGKFTMKYKVKFTGKKVEGKTYVYIEKEDGKLRITGIVES